MQRLAATTAFLASSVFTLTACAREECTHLADCAGAQMCSADGRCVDDDRGALAARNGGGEVGFGAGAGAGNGVGQGDVGFPDVVPNGATMLGAIGPIGGFNGDARVDVWSDDAFDSAIINVTAASDEGYGLFILTLANGIDGLPIGTSRFDAAGANDGLTYAQLCSDSSSVHFDGIPEETIITTTPTDDGGYHVEVTTTITDGFPGSTYADPAPTTLRVTFHLDA